MNYISNPQISTVIPLKFGNTSVILPQTICSVTDWTLTMWCFSLRDLSRARPRGLFRERFFHRNSNPMEPPILLSSKLNTSSGCKICAHGMCKMLLRDDILQWNYMENNFPWNLNYAGKIVREMGPSSWLRRITFSISIKVCCRFVIVLLSVCLRIYLKIFVLVLLSNSKFPCCVCVHRIIVTLPTDISFHLQAVNITSVKPCDQTHLNSLWNEQFLWVFFFDLIRQYPPLIIILVSVKAKCHKTTSHWIALVPLTDTFMQCWHKCILYELISLWLNN